MKTNEFQTYFARISKLVTAEKDELVRLDQAFGDGDLGITMDLGFAEALKYAAETDIEDTGKFFFGLSKAFNEAAPSSLGTIISFFFMGMAKSLKGVNDATLDDLKQAFTAGLNNIKTKCESKIGDKTIVDALEPAVIAFNENSDKDSCLKAAYLAAEKGMNATKDMVAVFGRAAYHKEKTLGHIDGGAYLAYLVFKALAND